MTIEIVHIDAFTAKPFCGNPAGVCLLEEPADEKWMQSVANELNLADTAFLVKVHGGWDLRWFTSEVEVDLCGHATLAAAHHLVEQAVHRTAHPGDQMQDLGAVRRGLERALDARHLPRDATDTGQQIGIVGRKMRHIGIPPTPI